MDECSLEQNFYGTANVQVVLRGEEGVVLDSRVLTTEVSRRTSNALRKRMLRLEKARKIGEMEIPRFFIIANQKITYVCWLISLSRFGVVG